MSINGLSIYSSRLPNGDSDAPNMPLTGEMSRKTYYTNHHIEVQWHKSTVLSKDVCYVRSQVTARLQLGYLA
jgi:hypothetical protein